MRVTCVYYICSLNHIEREEEENAANSKHTAYSFYFYLWIWQLDYRERFASCNETTCKNKADKQQLTKKREKSDGTNG